MKQYRTDVVFYSPTGTSRSVALAVARGLACGRGTVLPAGEGHIIDLTRDFSTDPVFLKNTVAVVSVPVYGGRVAETAVERLSRFHAEDSLAVTVVLYGNRAYDWRAFL